MNAVNNLTVVKTAEVVQEYRDMVYAIALTHTRQKSDADDIFQEVFLIYHRKAPAFAEEERRKAWLITTTLNCAKRLADSSWNKKIVPLHEQTSAEPLAEDFSFQNAEQDAILQALRELPAHYRSVLHLFYFEDLSVAQISRMLGIEPVTVRVRLNRARAQMRVVLKGDYFNE